MTLKRPVAGTNLEQARSHNRRVVIEAVRAAGAPSRAEIARRTALSVQTVSNIVGELEAGGLLVAAPTAKGARGQPAVPYSIAPGGGYSIGVQLDHLSLVGVLTDLSGTVRARIEHAVDQPRPQDALPLIAAMPDALAKEFPFDRGRLFGLGLAMPGPFGVEGLTSVGPTALPGWQDVSVADALQRLTGLAVTVENDATAAAIGERLHGVARALDSFVHLFVGTGLGAGLFLDGQIYSGSRRNAGEIGHMIAVPGGKPCFCGKSGCLERYVSLRAAYERLGLPDPDRATPRVLEERLSAADPALEAWLDEAAGPLRLAVETLELMLDPETIVLGGFAPPALLRRLIARLDPLHLSVSLAAGRSLPRLVLGSAGADASVLGAAALPVFSETNPRFDVLQKRLG